MISINNIQNAPLNMELQNLNSLVELRRQYMKEQNDAAAGKGICAGMCRAERVRIMCDLDGHIESTTKAINVAQKNIHEMIANM